MVSAVMAAQVHDCAGIDSETSDETLLISETHAEKGFHSKDQFNLVDDYAPKARKPYTITKQRERWTEDEHKKFLEALKLYGRAWRKIEEHVGSKTAVQIRSHAQKFFSKVARDSSDADDENPIEIPPPRPKKKPKHPYPRKSVCSPIKTEPTGSASSSLSAKSMLSPSSDAQIGSKLEQLEEQASMVQELDLLHQRETDSSHCLRLFGKTLLVSDQCSPLNTTSKTGKNEYIWSVIFQPNSFYHGSIEPAAFPTSCKNESIWSHGVHNPTPVKARFSSEMTNKDEEKEGSSTGSNTDLSCTERTFGADSYGFERKSNEQGSNSYKLRKQLSTKSVNSEKGFVPYQRCLGKRTSTLIPC